MPRVRCLHCSTEVPADDVNVGEGVAFCRSCGTLSRLADILNDDTDEVPVHVDATDPPAGCRIRDEGTVVRVVASARSWLALGTLFAAGFWNSIVSVFVLIALSGTLHHVFGSVPAWFPAPNFNSSGGAGIPLGVVIFLWIFLLPFIAVGAGLIGTCLTSLFGRCELSLRGPEGVAFTGFGPFGWRRRFDTSTVTSVRHGRTTWSQNDQRQPCVVIDTDARTIRIGSILTKQRQAWMAAALRRLLVP